MFDFHAHPGAPTSNALVCTASPREVLALTGNRYTSVGLLPGFEGEPGELEGLLQLGHNLGEIGIDKRFPDQEKQEEYFRMALSLGIEQKKLITIHSVRSDSIILPILKDMQPKAFIYHSFMGSVETAREIVKLNGFPSLSPKFKATRHFASFLSSGLPFLLETDLPTGEEQQSKLTAWCRELSDITGRDIETINDSFVSQLLN